MTIREALTAIQAAGIQARFSPAENPEQCDDSFTLAGNENICVQIGAGRNGLTFIGTFADGEGDDFGVTFGRETRDPVAAAREALALALA